MNKIVRTIFYELKDEKFTLICDKNTYIVPEAEIMNMQNPELQKLGEKLFGKNYIYEYREVTDIERWKTLQFEKFYDICAI